LAIGLPCPPFASADELFEAGLGVVLDHGHHVDGSRAFRETLDQQLVLRDPRTRVLDARASTFDLRVATARLVWHLAASSDLEHIAYYEPRVRAFSDDGRTVPGSNVGARIFGDEGGIDQFRGAIRRLRDDPASRRAALVVWEPDDSTRESRDIPCTTGMTLHLRADLLVATVVMRSNNALRLLPYNVFELSMLAELAAAELDVGLGPYVHLANSFHVFDTEVERASTVRASMPRDGIPEPMPRMPARPGPLDQTAELVDFEARLRASYLAHDLDRVDDLLSACERDLDPYWYALALVLASRDEEGRPVGSVLARTFDLLSPGHPFLPHMFAA
jgi:thymidylate synthase